MKQLMIQVERIVRPVRAMECRKLQMRRELLAHLQLAVAEEVARGQDEAAAIDAAVRRLGEPAELTKQLQRTVPWIQRILLAKMSVSPGIERWGTETTRKLYGVGPITLMHISILSTLAGLLGVLPYCMNPAVRDSLNHSGFSPAHPAAFFLSLLVIWQAIYLFSCRLVNSSADPIAPVQHPPSGQTVCDSIGAAMADDVRNDGSCAGSLADRHRSNQQPGGNDPADGDFSF